MKKNKDELEKKRKKYREWVAQNPYLVESGIEMKECEGCYCFIKNNYDFCFDCLDCDKMSCDENFNPNVGNCCACFSKKIGNPKLKRKELSFTQKQRLHFEQVKQQMDDLIEEIKDREDVEDMRTTKQIEDVKRWSQQEKERTLKELSLNEIYQEIERRKSLHKKMLRQCCSCQKKTDDLVELDLDWLECKDCYEDNNKWSEEWHKKDEAKSGGSKSPWEIEREEKEKIGCYWWCAKDCPQRNKSKRENK